MRLTIERTHSGHPDFIELVRQLDADLAIRDGADNLFYAQFNKIDKIKHALVAYHNGVAVGCGALRGLDEDRVEVKRMYVVPGSRGKGIATRVLTELEKWAAELAFPKCVLETGKRQPEAIQLYEKNGYHRIPNYGQYEGIDNSLCFEKNVTFIK